MSFKNWTSVKKKKRIEIEINTLLNIKYNELKR